MRNFKNTFILVMLCCMIPILVSTQNLSPEPSAEIIHSYFNFALERTKSASGFAPPVAARAFGYLGLCAYESVLLGSDSVPSFSEKLEGFQAPEYFKEKEYVWEVVVNEALTQLIKDLFFNLSDKDESELQAIRDSFLIQKQDITATVMVRSKVYGKAVAKAIFDYSKLDGGHNGQITNYTDHIQPLEQEGYWNPQNSQRALLPNWGANRLFFPQKNTTETKPSISFSKDTSSAFFQAATDVHEKCLRVDYRQRATILYWQDGVGSYTPAGHSMNLLKQLLMEEKANALQTARAYAIAGMTLSDAFVHSMRLKYRFQLIRPVDYIRNNIDPGFQTVLPTPPHPEFPSGHCTQVGAFSELMNVFFGDKYPFIDSSFANWYAPRMFSSFEKMAGEVSESRFLAGLHYEFSNEAGLVLGKNTAQNALLFLENLTTTEDLNVLSKSTLPMPFFFQNELIIKVRNFEHVDKIDLKTITGKTILTFKENLHTLDVSKYGGSHCKLVFYKDGIVLHTSVIPLRNVESSNIGVRRTKRPDASLFQQPKRN